MTTDDITTFFDTDEFASPHTVAGVAGVSCIVGEKTAGLSELDRTWVSMFEFSVKKTDITKPTKNRKLSFDGTSYTVENVKDDGNVLTITLSDSRDGMILNQV